MERSNRKILIGKVVSVKAAKTISVEVETSVKHPLYGKRYKQTNKFAAHDENGIAKLNDKVQIVETRPYSKTKNFRLEKVLETAKEGE